MLYVLDFLMVRLYIYVVFVVLVVSGDTPMGMIKDQYISQLA